MKLDGEKQWQKLKTCSFLTFFLGWTSLLHPQLLYILPIKQSRGMVNEGLWSISNSCFLFFFLLTLCASSVVGPPHGLKSYRKRLSQHRSFMGPTRKAASVWETLLRLQLLSGIWFSMGSLCAPPYFRKYPPAPVRGTSWAAACMFVQPRPSLWAAGESLFLSLEPVLPLLLLPWCPQGCFRCFFSSLLTAVQCFAFCCMYFTRGATMLADWLSYVLWWICWCCLAWGSPWPLLMEANSTTLSFQLFETYTQHICLFFFPK